MSGTQYLQRLDHSLTGDDAHPHLGAVLLRSKRLRPEQLDQALAEQVSSGRRLGEVLVERGWLFPQDIAQALAVQFGIEYVDINHSRSTSPRLPGSRPRSGSTVAQSAFAPLPTVRCSWRLRIRRARRSKRSRRQSTALLPLP